MRKLVYGMNVSLDGYFTAPCDDITWSEPSEELFQWWWDEDKAFELALYGRRLWETMSSYWPTGDQQPGALPMEVEFARNWRDTRRWCSPPRWRRWHGMPAWWRAMQSRKITRLKAEGDGRMSIGGATLAGAAMQAGLIDEYVLVTHPVLVGGGTPFFTTLDSRTHLDLIETRLFPGGVTLARYEARR